MGGNREKYKIAIAIMNNFGHFYSEPKMNSEFGVTNNIFFNCTNYTKEVNLNTRKL